MNMLQWHQAKMMREINRHIAKGGSCYVSYEAYGGGKRRIIRARMRKGQAEGLALASGKWLSLTGCTLLELLDSSGRRV